MLLTLFSPSEGKNIGGQTDLDEHILFGLESRKTILQRYNAIINSGDTQAIGHLFGIKKASDIAPYINEIFTAPVMGAIERYNGVAYEYLDFSSLSSAQQNYLKEHTVIFSNLFGPVMGGDLIANYKVKQGESIGEIAPDKYYKEAFSAQLDTLLDGHDILDLRAGYYDKFYKITKPYTTLKFMKEGKVVSHWAKAYRGIVLRHLALHNVESLEDFMKIEIEGLMVKEIKKIKNKTEVVFDIV